MEARKILCSGLLKPKLSNCAHFLEGESSMIAATTKKALSQTTQPNMLRAWLGLMTQAHRWFI